MKRASAFPLAVLSLLALTSLAWAGDDPQQRNSNDRSSSFKGWSSGNGQSQQFRNLSDVIRSFKKKYHNQSQNQPTHEPTKSPVVPFPIITDPIPTPTPVVRDHRDPVRPWGQHPAGQIDTSGAPGGTVVTSSGGNGPIIRDHRGQGPIIRDHRNPAPIVRDHRN